MMTPQLSWQPGPGGSFVPRIAMDAGPVLQGRSFLTLCFPDLTVPLPVAPQDVSNFHGSAAGLTVAGFVTAHGSDPAPFLAWEVRLTNGRPGPVRLRLEVGFDLEPGGPFRCLLPGVFYKENRPAGSVRRYPRYDPDLSDPANLVSPAWWFRTDRTAAPLLFAWTGGGMAMLGTDPPGTGPLPALGFDAPRGRSPRLGLRLPYLEEPVPYRWYAPPPVGPEGEWAELQPGETLTLRFYTAGGGSDLHGYSPLLRAMYDRWRTAADTRPWFPLPEGAGLAAEGLKNWHYDPDCDVLYETAAFEWVFSNGKPHRHRPHMHVAWVSGIPYAYALWQHGLAAGDAAQAEAGLRVLNRIAREGLAPCGLFWAEWTEEHGWGTGWNPNPDWLHTRTAGEATLFLARALAADGPAAAPDAVAPDRPAWQAAVAANLAFIAGHQRADGNLGSYYHKETGEVTEWDGAGGLIWIPALLLGARLLDVPAYAEAAARAGAYYARFVADAFLYGAPEDVHLTPTSEDGYNAVMAFTALYEATGESKWLDLARQAAEWTLTFRLAYNTPFPPETPLALYDYRTVGGDIASPCNPHLHNYGLICSRELLALYQATGDLHYVERVRDHLQCFLQFIARRDGDFGARRGMISEQWYHTDGIAPKGTVLGLSHSWCAGLVILAAREAHDFGDVVIDWPARRAVALEAVTLRTEAQTAGLRLVLANPWPRPLRLSLRLTGAPANARLEADKPLTPDGEGRWLLDLAPSASASVQVHEVSEAWAKA